MFGIDPFVLLAPVLLLGIVGLLRFIGCVGADPQTETLPTADIVTFSLPGGVYAVPPPPVTLASSKNATIYFTRDGNDPRDASKRTNYSGPLDISATTRIRAIAGGPGFNDGPPSEATYTIQAPPSVRWVVAKEFSSPDTHNDSFIATPDFMSPVNVSDLIVVWIWRIAPAGVTVASVEDTAGNVDELAVGPTDVGFQGTPEIRYARVTMTGPPLHVTANFSAAFIGKKVISAHRYTGLGPAWTLREVDWKSGASADPACGPVPATANDLVFGAALTSGQATAGAGFTQRSAADDNVVEDQLAAGPQANATFNTGGTSVDWIAQMATFK